MKASTSNQTFTPLCVPLPITTAAYSMSSVDISSTTVQQSLVKKSAVSKPETQENVLFYEESAHDTPFYKSKSSTTLTSESPLSKAGTSIEASLNTLTHDDINSIGFLDFMKKLMGEKAFNSINLLSICFFLSGGLLMFYLLNLI